MRPFQSTGVRTLPVALALLVSSLAVASCNWAGGCAGVGYHAVHVTIRDQQGNPIAIGATVTLHDGAYLERAGTQYDPLNVYAAADRGGRRYDIQVTKSHYNERWVRGVRAPGGGCVTGHEEEPVTITVPVVLTLAAGAPPVRSVSLLPPHILLDRPPWQGVGTFTAYVDANVGLSRDVLWRISGDTGSVDFDAATGTVRYRCRSRSGNLIVTARSIEDTLVFGVADVAVQGHPATPADPPCS
ncbi:MAG: hypothetical protein IPP90_11495 [Gemmatimonadaceae bacterium]|nr:hypothetical protein [Gemmatimonadaceae bacterium]